jgi:hypothetical protein
VPMRVIANKRCRVMIEPPELQAPLYPTPAGVAGERSALIYCTSGSGDPSERVVPGRACARKRTPKQPPSGARLGAPQHRIQIDEARM